MKYIFTFIMISAIFAGCSDDTSVTPNGNQPGKYSRILTIESGDKKFEIWSSSASTLIYGYNDIGFKVFSDGLEKTNGFVKYLPTMYHGIGGPSHTVPVKENFYYDSADKLFKGYVIFIMYDSSAFWASDYNFNNEFSVDSSVFDLSMNYKSQIYAWDNVNTQRVYILTLVSPLSPRVGSNEMTVMLHESSGFFTFSERDSAEMHIRPWMESMGHGSPNNVNPISIGGGYYKGNVNFTMSGEWYVYDSIRYNGTVLTKTPPPKFIYDVQ